MNFFDKHTLDQPSRGKRHHREVRDNRGRRRGATILLVAGGMVAMLGFVAMATDYGLMVSTRNKLQRASEAGAVAGAVKLPDQATAQGEASYVTQLNNTKAPEVTVTFPSGSQQCQVTTARTLKLFFAPAIGIPTGTVRATATAARLPVTGVTGAMPIAITTTDYNSYTQNGTRFDGSLLTVDLIRNHEDDFNQGDVVALDTRPGNSGKSPAQFLEDVLNGADDVVIIGQQENALNASLASQGPRLQQGIAQHIRDASDAPYNDTGLNYTYPNYPANDPRVVTIIVADPARKDNNNPMITVRKLVRVYLQTVGTNGKGKADGVSVQMRILPPVTISSDTPGIQIGSDSSASSDLSVVHLTG